MKEILENDSFVLTEDDGTTKTYSTLFTFYNKKYNKNYVVYTDYISEIDETTSDSTIYASIYNPEDPYLNIIHITNEEELDMIKQQIDEIMIENIDESSIYDREVTLYDGTEI